MTALPIDMVSDVVCPWCFIGKRRLEKAIALNPEIPVEMRFRPYFLNPWVPREGISREEYLTTKFGSPERYRSIAQRVAQAAAAEGLSYALDRIKRQPNTLDCHRLIRWAGSIAQRVAQAAAAEGLNYALDRIKRQPNTLDCHRLIRWAGGIGNAAGMKQRLMDLYFTEGGDLTDRNVLVQAAADCGLDGERVRQQLASDEDVASVEREAESAKEAGIEGVPCFIFGGLTAVSGAQAPDHLAQAIERAADEYAKRVAAE